MQTPILPTAAPSIVGASSLELRQAAARGDSVRVISLVQAIPDPARLRTVINAQGADSGKTALHRALEGILQIAAADPARGELFWPRSADASEEEAIRNFLKNGVRSPLLDSIPQAEIQIKAFQIIAVLLLVKGADPRLVDRDGCSALDLIFRTPQVMHPMWIHMLRVGGLDVIAVVGEDADARPTSNSDRKNPGMR